MFVLFRVQSHVASEHGEAEDNDLVVFSGIRWRRFVFFFETVELEVALGLLSLRQGWDISATLEVFSHTNTEVSQASRCG